MKFYSFMVGGILLEMAMCGSALSMNIQYEGARAHQIVNRHDIVWHTYVPPKAVFRRIMPRFSLSNGDHLYKIAKYPVGRDALVEYAASSGDRLVSLDCLDAVLRRIGDAIKWDMSYALARIVQDPIGVEALYGYATIAIFGTESMRRKLVAIASMQNPANHEDIDEAIAAATNTLLSKYGYSLNNDGVLTAP